MTLDPGITTVFGKWKMTGTFGGKWKMTGTFGGKWKTTSILIQLNTFIVCRWKTTKMKEYLNFS
jgi:hypothetical protein